MSGRPGLAELEAKIKGLGGDDYVWARIADGEKMRTIMESLGVSRTFFYVWKKARPERAAAYKEAQELAGHAHAEDASDPLEDAGMLTGPEVTLRVARSNYLRWLATVKNRDVYGDKSGPTVQISVGSLHLDALRSGGTRVLPSAPAELVAGDGE